MCLSVRARPPTEHTEAVALLQIVRLHTGRWPELGLLFAIPNGAARHIVVARKLKAEGVKAGVPDLFLPVARGGFHGLFVELKSMTGVASREQTSWVAALRGQGYRAEVCRGAPVAWQVIRGYLEG